MDSPALTLWIFKDCYVITWPQIALYNWVAVFISLLVQLYWSESRVLQSWPKRHGADPALPRCQIPRWQEWSHSAGSVCAGELFFTVCLFMYCTLSLLSLVLCSLCEAPVIAPVCVCVCVCVCSGWIRRNVWDPHSASRPPVSDPHPDDTEWWY